LAWSNQFLENLVENQMKTEFIFTNQNYQFLQIRTAATECWDWDGTEQLI
jgi:hypothetical protein